jgi:1-acyl-sn-glycerol-3-phosphate acyltransferase
MLWFYRIANLFFRLCFLIAFDYYVEGLENVPRQGALIVAINHFSFADPLLVGTFFPRQITMLGKAELFEIPVFGRLVELYGTIRVRRGQGDHVALRKSLEVLTAGDALLIAPEGTRGPEGTLKPGREGTALVAYRAGAIILPVAIWGPKDLWSNLRRLRKTEVHMVAGKPFKPRSPVGARASREEFVALTDEIMLRIAELLPPQYRGVYADRIADDAASVLSP